MPAGLQVFAQDGSNKLQIDSNAYPNLHMRNKGSSATTTMYFPITGGNVTYVKVNFGSGYTRRPIIAVNCTSLVSVGSIDQEVDGSWSAYFYVRAEIGAPFSWWAFDNMTSGDLSNFGFQVFSASGAVIFDAAHKPMKVVGTLVSDGITGQTINLTAGRSYAAWFNPGGRAIPVGTGAGILLTWGVSIVNSTGVVTLGSFQINTITGGVTASNGPVSGLVLDVTNF